MRVLAEAHRSHKHDSHTTACNCGGEGRVTQGPNASVELHLHNHKPAAALSSQTCTAQKPREISSHEGCVSAQTREERAGKEGIRTNRRSVQIPHRNIRTTAAHSDEAAVHIPLQTHIHTHNGALSAVRLQLQLQHARVGN